MSPASGSASRRDGHPAAARPFADAMVSVEGAMPTLRLVYLGFLGNARFNGFLGRYPGSFEFASGALGIESAWEERILNWHEGGEGPLGPAILEASVDTVVGSGGSAVAEAFCQAHPGKAETLGSTVGMREVMDCLEPQASGFARMVDAERQVAGQRPEDA